MENEPYVILFDGVCNFCNSSVNFIIDRDKKGRFIFGSLQSEAGKKLLSYHKVTNIEKFDSVILIKNHKLYRKSSAALEIARHLNALWPLVYFFKVIPWFIRDLLYDLIAKNRYRLFGKSEACRIPDPALKDRFLH